MLAHEIMVRDVVTIPLGTSLAEAASVLLRHQINAMPVLDEWGRIVGMIGLRDVLRVPTSHRSDMPIIRWDSLVTKARLLTETPVDHVMARQLVYVAPDTDVIEVAAIMANRGIHPIPVLSGDRLLGVIGRADIAQAMLRLLASPPARGRSDPVGG